MISRIARTIAFLIIAVSLCATASAQQTSKHPTQNHKSQRQAAGNAPSNSASSNAASSKASPSAASIQVYFGPRATDDVTGVFYNMLRFFDSAKSSIYGSAHEIDMVAVAEKLAARAEQGVDVQIVVESRWMSLPKDRTAINILKNSKVKLIPDTKKSGLMHNKFFIVDKQRVWTGSTNITETCLLYNYNNGVWIEDAKIAENFLSEFEEQREGNFGKRGSGQSNTPYPYVKVGGVGAETYFSPEDNPMPAIVDFINGARKNVDIMCFVFSSQDIGEALVAAHKRGVKVRVLLDNSFSSPGALASWRYVPYKALSAAGITCKYDDEDAKLHHKVVIVDSARVMTGSFNLSNNAAKSNDENFLIIDSTQIAAKYQQEFEKLWVFFKGSPGASPVPDDEDKENGSGDKPEAVDNE